MALIPIVTAFDRSPDGGRGLAREMPVRWALHELGKPCSVRRLSFDALKQPPHRALHPFGQIPTFEQGDLVLFESGAIVLHLAQTHPGLLPDDPAARARAQTWMFAAVATVEPPIFDRAIAMITERDQAWYAARLPLLDDRVRRRLHDLAVRLGDGPWIDGPFSVADLLLISVLRRMQGSDLLAEFPALAAYIARGEARPAFQRAFAEQHLRGTEPG